LIKIKKFQNNHLKEAAELFISNYNILRQTISELPDKYENRDLIQSKLTKVIEDNPSAVAIYDNKIVGYLTGYSGIESFKGSSTGAYIPELAHSSIRDDKKEKIYNKLYRYLAKEMIATNSSTQAITFLANDSIAKDVFYQLGFGLFVIDAIRSIKKVNTKQIKGVVIRKAVEKDLADLKKLDKKILKHLNQSPIYLNRDYTEKSLDEMKNKFFGSDRKTFVAEKDGHIVSCVRVLVNKGGGCELVQDEGTLGINFAYTEKNMRNTGLASNILGNVLNWGLKNNMKRCSVDFESANIEGRKFWLKHFNPVCYSAIRKLDDRIVVDKK
jgi:hypothetical protein